MPRRKWEAKTKALVVLEGLQGKSVAEICPEHQISQSLYYQWRDQFLKKRAWRRRMRGSSSSSASSRLSEKKATSGWPDAAAVAAGGPV